MLMKDEPIRLLLIFTAYLYITSGRKVPEVCEFITVRQCKNMPYNYTKLPNSLNHESQVEISRILSDYEQLLQTRCSEYLQKFLCSLFVPFCTELDTFILPCKDLCLDSKKKCEKHMKEVGYSWPDILDCNKFPNKDQEKYICIPLESDYNDTGQDSTELLFTYKDVDSKEVEVDTTSKEEILILLSSRHQILLYDVRQQDLITLYTGLDNGASIDFHYKHDKEQYVFWAGSGDGTIRRATLIQAVLRDMRVVAETVQSNIESLAVDWVTNHLFWLESYPATLKVSTLDGGNPTILHTFTKTKGQSQKVPTFLVVDPLAGYLFWVEFEGDLYTPGVSIERFNLKTKSTFTVFNISRDNIHNMGRPKGLVLDMEKQRVYWTDARSESIQSIGYDGRNFKMVVTSPEFLGEPLALTKYRNNLYWSDDVTNSIGKTTIDNGKRPSFIETLTASEAIDLKVFHQEVQPQGKAEYQIQLKSKASDFHGNKNCIISLLFIFIFACLL